MGMNDPSSIERRIGAHHRVHLILWAAQMMALVILFSLAVSVFHETTANNPMLFWVLAGLSLLLVAASFAVKQKLFAQGVEKQSMERVQQGQIAAVALCEAAGLVGLLSRVLTGSPYFYLLFAVAGLGMLLHFPRREALMATSFKNRL